LVAPGRYRLPTRPSTRATVDGETTGSKLGPYRLLGSASEDQASTRGADGALAVMIIGQWVTISLLALILWRLW
jgi:hypothetical protein